MQIIKYFDVKVFITLAVLTIGQDYFNDIDFNIDDIIYGIGAAIIGTFVWGFFKKRLGF